VPGKTTRPSPKSNSSTQETRKLLAAVAKDSDTFDDLPERLKSDRNFATQAVQTSPLVYPKLPKALQQDRDIVLATVKAAGGWWLGGEDCPSQFRADREIVLVAVRQDRGALEHAAPKLRADREIVFAAVKNDGLALEHAAPKLRADREIVFAAVKNEGLALEHAAPKLRADREIVFAAVRENSGAVQYAGGAMARNKELALLAIEDRFPVKLLSPKVRADREVIVAAVSRLGGFGLSGVQPDFVLDAELLEQAFPGFPGAAFEPLESDFQECLDKLEGQVKLSKMKAGESHERVGCGLVGVHCLSRQKVTLPDKTSYEVAVFNVAFQAVDTLMCRVHLLERGKKARKTGWLYADWDENESIGETGYIGELLGDLDDESDDDFDAFDDDER